MISWVQGKVLKRRMKKENHCVINCWELKETPEVQEVYGQTDKEYNAYERTYTRAQAKVAYIDVD